MLMPPISWRPSPGAHLLAPVFAIEARDGTRLPDRRVSTRWLQQPLYSKTMRRLPDAARRLKLLQCVLLRCDNSSYAIPRRRDFDLCGGTQARPVDKSIIPGVENWIGPCRFSVLMTELDNVYAEGRSDRGVFAACR
ncbi:hypothetical protein CHELA40_13405 [Chelatococcus asaccharovorans]|nr:hypothetical protein CHELA40_13405 [Chelatococcus asaccharovorans]CAH1678239.1 hypothetical protein CHELA17_62213 [Chelatococcus asaccharovorans]